jgi:hypothetical protein
MARPIAQAARRPWLVPAIGIPTPATAASEAQP